MSQHGNFARRCSARTSLVRDSRIAEVLQAIAIEPAREIAELARRVHLSPSRLSHLFRDQVGQSLYGFLADRRLERAAELLQRTSSPVKEVSYNVGYRHPSSFVRAFRRKFGCSPNDYREEAVA